MHILVHTCLILLGSAPGTSLTCPCRLILASFCLCLPLMLYTLTYNLYCSPEYTCPYLPSLAFTCTYVPSIWNTRADLVHITSHTQLTCTLVNKHVSTCSSCLTSCQQPKHLEPLDTFSLVSVSLCVFATLLHNRISRDFAAVTYTLVYVRKRGRVKKDQPRDSGHWP